eukprot:CAMPEP_0198505976 /NCGR_PEP_ID=MMETSP1462-20131121/11376_1 /TAXON_ID=1333877 /ORGANISM="Brandtodinium nutriculum, Strain RCC3387" /LENGTH=40 /DNA_ID= /DNA_START= /DNA_END= /DNA_ORIENTATION=
MDSNTAVQQYHATVASLVALSKEAGERNVSLNSPIKSNAV